MGRLHHISISLFVAVATLAAAVPAEAQSNYRLVTRKPAPSSSITVPADTKQPLVHWDLREFPNCQIPYTVFNAGPDGLTLAQWTAAVDAAFNTWQGVTPAVISFTRTPGSTATASSGGAADGINLITYAGAGHADMGSFPGNPSGVIGITATFVGANSKVNEADVILNDRDYQWNRSVQDFEAVRSGVAPFNVNNGQTVIVRVDGGAAQTITLAGVTNGAATANEVGSNLAGLAGVRVFLAGPNRFRIVSRQHNGTGTIQVTGGTATPNLGLPGALTFTDTCDIETITVHELGHFVQIHHSVSPGGGDVAGGPIMCPGAPNTGTKRAATPEDAQALNFLYTPDLGDATDPAAGTPNQYQTRVHSAAAQVPARTLNGVALTQIMKGPYQQFAHAGAAPFQRDRFEWLGTNEDGHENECEARVPNQDNFDDGVTFTPANPERGRVNRIRVTISHSAQPGRYSQQTAYDDTCLVGGPGCNCGRQFPVGTTAADFPFIGPGANNELQTTPNNCMTPAVGGDDQVDGMGRITVGANRRIDTIIEQNSFDRRRLYLNGYFDFDGNNKFDPADLRVWWEGIPRVAAGNGFPFVNGETLVTSNNWQGTTYFDNRTVVDFDVFVPLNAPEDFYARFRLDYGEDEGRRANFSGDNAPAEGAGQFGEVEDYPIHTVAGPIPDDCNSPIPVEEGYYLFSTVGATTDGPDEPAACDFFGDTQVGCDVWFCYTASCEGVTQVDLCGTSYDAKLAVYHGCSPCPTEASAIACNDDFCGEAPRVTFNAMYSNSYLIRVGGYNCATGDVVMYIACSKDACIVRCPEGATLEGEANCGLPQDDFNGGCNSDPYAFGAISCGETICGTSAANGGLHDTDWYEFTLEDPSDVTIGVESEFNSVAMILDDQCAPTTIASGAGGPCEAYTVSAKLAAGTWRVFISPQGFSGTPCETGTNRYLLTLTCQVQTQACCFSNGGCEDAPPSLCLQLSGTPQGPGTECSSAQCPQPSEACCLADGSCIDIDAATCISALNGAPQGPGTTCATSACVYPTSPCCFPNGTCDDLDPAVCIAAGGAPGTPGTLCINTVCPCLGDVNGDRWVSLADIARVIACWGQPPSCNPAADQDGSGLIGLGDIAIIIQYFGQHCP